jgi:2-oxoglutarate dehydrogenase E1 component
MTTILDKYTSAKEFIWAQEEPENMGAWIHVMYMFMKHKETKNIKLSYVGRLANASPATGFSKTHGEQQLKIINGIISKSKVVSQQS